MSVYRIAFFGSSLVSAYWNGAATYYRGILKELARLGADITFYEPDAFNRQQHRDIEDPDYARVAVYTNVDLALESAAGSDLIVKASGVGVHDEYLEAAVTSIKKQNRVVAFWDVDAPATLERMQNNAGDAFRNLVPKYDVIFTYGGGQPVIDAYAAFGAKRCVPIYNALDPETHHPVPSREELRADLTFLGNRLPDREARVYEFFLNPASCLPKHKFLLGGSGWEPHQVTGNVKLLGHVYTADHNALNTSARAVLNISRESMARFGFSPATRAFEAAGAAACVITDQWAGIDYFFEPGREILVARDGHDVAEYVSALGEDQARRIGQAAIQRVLAEHTYRHRARQVDDLLGISTHKQTALTGRPA